MAVCCAVAVGCAGAVCCTMAVVEVEVEVEVEMDSELSRFAVLKLTSELTVFVFELVVFLVEFFECALEVEHLGI